MPDAIEAIASLLRSGRASDAVTLFTANRTSWAADESVCRLAATAFAVAGDPLGGLRELQPWLAASSAAQRETLEVACRICTQLGRQGDLFSLRVRIARLHPEDPVVWRELTSIAIATRAERDALGVMRSVGLAPLRQVDVGLCCATLLARSGDLDGARIEFERLLWRYPNHTVGSLVYRELMCREFPWDARRGVSETPCDPGALEFGAIGVRAALDLPVFFDSDADATFWRGELLRRMGELRASLSGTPLLPEQRVAALERMPVTLPYHDADVTRELCAWGDLVACAVAPAVELLRDSISVPSRGSLKHMRVGVVSNRVSRSSAGRFFASWIDALLAAGMDVNLYTAEVRDDVTARYGSLVRRWFHVDGVGDWRSLAGAILADDNDVLLYPELGGSMLLQLVAAMRLAPLQCAGFGVPCTTGLPTIDVFFSPSAAENPDASTLGHYRERLVPLSGFGAAIERPPPASRRSRAELFLPEGVSLILVAQTHDKWSPAFVDALSDVLLSAPEAHVLTFGPAIGGTEKRVFDMWIERRFSARGLSAAQRLHVSPLLSHEDYLAAAGHCTVSIDTFGFGGGATTLDAISIGLPYIALEGLFLRARQAASFLRAADAADCIAGSRGEYVQLVVRALSDAAWRASVAHRLRANGNLLFQQRSGPESLAAFLVNVTRGGEVAPLFKTAG